MRSGTGCPLYVPENGFIGINVPLTPPRWEPQHADHAPALHVPDPQRARPIGMDHAIENPYRLLTKGELLERCANLTVALDS